jgi:hypothetical protein
MSERFSVEGLRHAGFGGFVPARQVFLDRAAAVIGGPGVYVVLRTAQTAPEFLEISKGGHFKEKDPTVASSVLRARMVAGTPVLYIGKADSLQRRIRQLLDFGNGRPVGHYGGRYLWQLAGSDEFLIAWRTDPSPRAAETELLDAFISEFGSLPFANIVR